MKGRCIIKLFHCFILIIITSILIPHKIFAKQENIDKSEIYIKFLNKNKDKFLGYCMYDINQDTKPELICVSEDKPNSYFYKIYSNDNNILTEKAVFKPENAGSFVINRNDKSIYYCEPENIYFSENVKYYSISSINETYSIKMIAELKSSFNMDSMRDLDNYPYKPDENFFYEGIEISEYEFLNKLKFGSALELFIQNKNFYKYAIPEYNENAVIKNYEKYPIKNNPSLTFNTIATVHDAFNNKTSYVHVKYPSGLDDILGTKDSKPSLLMINGTFVERPNIIRNDNRTLLPVRLINEYFGNKVTWNPDSRSIEIIGENIKITLEENNKNAKVNNKAVILDTPPIIYNNHTYVPLRFISESLNKKIQYIDDLGSMIHELDKNNLSVITIDDVLPNTGSISENEARIAILTAIDEAYKSLDNGKIDSIKNNLIFSNSFGRYYVFKSQELKTLILIDSYNREIFHAANGYGSQIGIGLPSVE